MYAYDGNAALKRTGSAMMQVSMWLYRMRTWQRQKPRRSIWKSGMLPIGMQRDNSLWDEIEAESRMISRQRTLGEDHCIDHTPGR
jgi:hypothetical protein